jgi:hypothetical protein
MMMRHSDSGLPSGGATPAGGVWVVGTVIFWIGSTLASAAPSLYPRMAPIDQYRIANRAQEITLARSAAPHSVSDHAQVLVLGEHGYETAVAGHNGFVCLVVRSWDQGFQDPEFWNPKIRSPECFNPPAVRSVLPRYLQRTKWVLAGESTAQMRARIRAASAAGKLVDPAPGALCYMMSQDGYLGDRVAGPWYPHVMFFENTTAAALWGANLPGTLVAANSTSYRGITFFMVIVPRWSNGAWLAHK